LEQLPERVETNQQKQARLAMERMEDPVQAKMAKKAVKEARQAEKEAE